MKNSSSEGLVRSYSKVRLVVMSLEFAVHEGFEIVAWADRKLQLVKVYIYEE